MDIFVWKLWRFGWSDKIEPYRIYGVDGDGGWVRIMGHLWWLKEPYK